MHFHVLVQEPGQPERAVPVRPGPAAEPLPSLRVSAAESDGVVVESLGDAVSFADGPAAPGSRRLLRAGESVRAGQARLVVEGREAGTATQARRILLSALRGELLPAGPSIEVVEGPEAGRLLPLRAGVLGRGPGADLRISDAALSRSHARIRLDGARVLLEDLGSTNGTWLGGRRVTSLRELRPGEEARAGRTVFALALAGHPRAPAPAVAPAVATGASGPPRLARAALAAAIAAAVAAAALAAWTPGG